MRSLSKQGKHCVEFHLNYEKRWLNMKKIAFFIAERPPPSAVYLSGDKKVLSHQLIKGGKTSSNNAENGDEFKDDYDTLDESDGLAPIDDIDSWVYVEDISIDFSFAQSVLFKIFGGCVQETGHKTRGHICLTDEDKYNAKYSKGSLLYGELLPRGANKAFGPKRLAAENARTLFDLGCGTGKIAIQAFLQFRNLEYVYGIELSEGRYKVAEEACLRMVSLLGKDSYEVRVDPGKSIMVTELAQTVDGINATSNTDGVYSGRCLHLEFGNLFDTRNIEQADIVMLETDIPVTLHDDLCEFLNKLQPQAKVLSYLDFRKIWAFSPFTFKQLDVNKHLSDRFPTSWSVQRGHHFFLWVKVTNAVLIRGNTKLNSSSRSFRRSFNSRFLGTSWGKKGDGDATDDSNSSNPSSDEGRCLPSGFLSFLSTLFPFRILFKKKPNPASEGHESNNSTVERDDTRLEITANTDYSDHISHSKQNADATEQSTSSIDQARINTNTSTQSTLLAIDSPGSELIPTHADTLTNSSNNQTSSSALASQTRVQSKFRNANTDTEVDLYEDESEGSSSENEEAGGSSWVERGSEGQVMDHVSNKVLASDGDGNAGMGISDARVDPDGVRASVDTFIQKATSNILGMDQVNVPPISMTHSIHATAHDGDIINNRSTKNSHESTPAVSLFPSNLNDRVLSRSMRSVISTSTNNGTLMSHHMSDTSYTNHPKNPINLDDDLMLCLSVNDDCCCIETDYNASRLRESSEHWVKKMANGDTNDYILNVGVNSGRSSEKSDDDEFIRSPQHRRHSSSQSYSQNDHERNSSPVAVAKMATSLNKILLPPGSPSEGSETIHRSGLTPKRLTAAKMMNIDDDNDDYGTDGVAMNSAL